MCERPGRPAPVRRFPGGSRRHPFKFGTLPVRPLTVPRPLPPTTPWFDGEPPDAEQAAP